MPKAAVRHTRIAFTALYCSGVMYSAGCCAYSSHHRLKKSDKRYFFAWQPSVYMSFNKSIILVSLFPLFLPFRCKLLIYSCFSCLEIFPKLVQHLFRQQRVTAFLTLAHDAYQHPFTDNVLWGEVQQFAPSQTGGIDQGNHAVMFPVRQTGEDTFDLVPAQHFG